MSNTNITTEDIQKLNAAKDRIDSILAKVGSGKTLGPKQSKKAHTDIQYARLWLWEVEQKLGN